MQLSNPLPLPSRRAQPASLSYGLVLLALSLLSGVSGAPVRASDQALLLTAPRVFDGERLQRNWAVLVEGRAIAAVGPLAEVEHEVADARRIELREHTLLPGLIDAHTHLLLHPYDETSWADQVLRESQAERVARATQHANATLRAGFTTLRDLGSEGAGYADVGLRQAIEKGVLAGPRLQVAGRALVATGSYGPKGFAEHVRVPLGAEEADGAQLERAVRRQIGYGIDLVKVYADYRWGPNGEARPTYSLAELERIVQIAADSGRPTVAHASSAEAMRRATLAGVRSIEHGDEGTAEVFQLMAVRGVALCPTIAAGDAISRYRGWNGEAPEPPRVVNKRRSVAAALAAGVEICAGGDAGVFSHGENARELELLVGYGMTPLQALRAATSVNARVLGLREEIGRLAPGMAADLVAVRGDPSAAIEALREVALVMQAGEIMVDERR